MQHKILSALILSFGLALSALAQDGIGIESQNSPRSVGQEQVDAATRGGVLRQRGSGETLRMVCVDPHALSIDACEEFQFAAYDPAQSHLSFLRVSFTRADLESRSTFKDGIQAKFDEFHPGNLIFDRDRMVSGMIMVFPAVWVAETDNQLYFLGLLVSVPIGIASLPFTALYGAVDAAVVKHKWNRFLSSIVHNRHSIHTLGKSTQNELRTDLASGVRRPL